MPCPAVSQLALSHAVDGGRVGFAVGDTVGSEVGPEVVGAAVIHSQV